ncbi:hypothetical protein EVA_13400 [gut metagenome]|uniref:Uncharacterized protein n=2 Tax=gut metagenome TaxID=749906 RepID=J9G9N9_9ZZZZ
MEISNKEQHRAHRYLESKGIDLTEITAFSFMQRYIVEPKKHDRSNQYGPGLLTLQLKSDEKRTYILHMRNHPTSIIRTLVAANIPFSNLHRPTRTEAPQPTCRYHRTSLYMIWFFALFLTCLIFGFHFTAQTTMPYHLMISLPFFAGSIYALYLLQTRFCHLRLDNNALTIFSAGRSIHYPYTQILKVNFDFAREPNATHVMELLDTDYRYRLFYIGRTPRKSLNEITKRLQQAGIDATCSLNDEKKHYNDVYHVQ